MFIITSLKNTQQHLISTQGTEKHRWMISQIFLMKSQLKDVLVIMKKKANRSSPSSLVQHGQILLTRPTLCHNQSQKLGFDRHQEFPEIMKMLIVTFILQIFVLK